MSIEPIASAVAGLAQAGAAGGVAPDAGGFTDAIQKGMQAVSDLETGANTAIQDVASGGDTSIAELMTATAKAELGVQMLAQVRDRAVEAYNEIMRMQV